MKRVWHHVGGVLFDAVCVAAGYGVGFLSAVADYTGDTPATFWYFRLALSTLPVALLAWASTSLFRERHWRGWLRFACFEWMALWIGVGALGGDGNFAYGGRFVPAVLLDAAVFLMVLNVSRFHGRAVV